MLGCGAGDDVATPHGLHASFPGRDPSLRREADGTLHVAYVQEQPDGPAVFYRRLGPHPLEPVQVSPTQLEVKAHGETPPALEILPGGTLVVAYPVALPGKWKSEIRLQRSTDGGAHWMEPELLHPERNGSQAYLSSAVTAAGEPVFAWLDDSMGHKGLQARWGSAPPVMLDPETCDCCGTALLAGREGEIWLAYRDAQNDVRDFRVLRADLAGSKFDRGRALSADGWKIQGCPHTGARMAQAVDGVLWAAWFTGGEGQAGIYAASSADGGDTFSSRILVAAAGPGRIVRHPELGALPDGGLVVLYEADGNGQQGLMAQVRDPRTGAWEQPRLVAPGGSYPRWAGGVSEATVAFTCHTAGGPQVIVADWAMTVSGELGGMKCEKAAAH
jgi:hypothetical protein